MTLDKLFEHAKQQAVKIFDEYGEVMPTWLLITANGDLVPLVMPLSAMADKDKLAQALAIIFSDGRVVRYVSMLEAWSVALKNEAAMKEVLDNIDETPIREHPRRIEIVHLMAEDKHHMRSGHFTIVRPSSGKPFLSEFQEDDATRAEGRFCNLLANGEGIH